MPEDLESNPQTELSGTFKKNLISTQGQQILARIN